MTYLPAHFEQDDPGEIRAFLATNPFGTIVVNLNGELWPTPIPLIWKPSKGEWGKFIAHVAIDNDMWRADLHEEVLVIMQGPNTYITPNWYPSKADDHKVLPTWNYTSVHAWGKMTIHHDPKFKRMAVGLLTQIHERSSEQPWKMGDAPQDFLNTHLEHVVGLEIEIDRICAKAKLNQNRTESARQGVIAGLEKRATGDDALIRDLMVARRDRGSR